ncbi:hypothetical protein [Fusobacterium sp. PH5-44]|uniref:hypothetical protein n=1 Tax=unclassified Fusobacterium TaxID=2648384 RepID=UPI003D197094
MRLKLSKSGAVRETMPDDFWGQNYMIIKVCSTLKLTNQIKILTNRVITEKAHFILKIEEKCILSEKLEAFIEKNKKYIKIER